LNGGHSVHVREANGCYKKAPRPNSETAIHLLKIKHEKTGDNFLFYIFG